MRLVPARVHTPELLDQPDNSADDLEAAFRDIRRTNRWLGGRAALLRGLERQLAQTDPARSLEILDIGTGAADLPRAMVEHGRTRSRRIRVTAVDASLTTARIAAGGIDRHPDVRVVCADAFRLPFPDARFDVVTASLFLHHFTHDQIICLLRAFRRLARRAVLINDLRRHAIPWAFIHVVSRLTGRSPLYVHDAPLSILRGFVEPELVTAARAAGAGTVRLRRCWPYRLLLELPGAGS